MLKGKYVKMDEEVKTAITKTIPEYLEIISNRLPKDEDGSKLFSFNNRTICCDQMLLQYLNNEKEIKPCLKSDFKQIAKELLIEDPEETSTELVDFIMNLIPSCNKVDTVQFRKKVEKLIEDKNYKELRRMIQNQTDKK